MQKFETCVSGSPEGQNRTAGTFVPYGFEVRTWGHPGSPRHKGMHLGPAP